MTSEFAFEVSAFILVPRVAFHQAIHHADNFWQEFCRIAMLRHFPQFANCSTRGFLIVPVSFSELHGLTDSLFR